MSKYTYSNGTEPKVGDKVKIPTRKSSGSAHFSEIKYDLDRNTCGYCVVTELDYNEVLIETNPGVRSSQYRFSLSDLEPLGSFTPIPEEKRERFRVGDIITLKKLSSFQWGGSSEVPAGTKAKIVSYKEWNTKCFKIYVKWVGLGLHEYNMLESEFEEFESSFGSSVQTAVSYTSTPLKTNVISNSKEIENLLLLQL